MFLISGADRKLENVTEGSWDGSHFRGVIKTQKVVSEVGRGYLQTLSRWSLLSILTDTCAGLIKYGGDREVGQDCAKASTEREPLGDQRQHLQSIGY